MTVIFLYTYLSLYGLINSCFSCLPQDLLFTSFKSSEIYNSAEYSDKQTIKTTSVNFGEYKLVINTTIIYDSLLSCNLILDYKIIGQRIHFYKGAIETTSFIFNPQKVKVSTVHIKHCKVFENTINNISVLQGRKGWLYEINGAGVTGNQTEYIALFTPEGHLLYYSYSTYRNKTVRGVPHELKGNLDKTLKEYGIEMNLFSHPKNVTNVDY